MGMTKGACGVVKTIRETWYMAQWIVFAIQITRGK